jgi:hypothetical protein
MEIKKALSPFQEVHKRIQEALDHSREVREREAELRKKKAEEEAVREGFGLCLTQDFRRN